MYAFIRHAIDTCQASLRVERSVLLELPERSVQPEHSVYKRRIRSLLGSDLSTLVIRMFLADSVHLFGICRLCATMFDADTPKWAKSADGE